MTPQDLKRLREAGEKARRYSALWLRGDITREEWRPVNAEVEALAGQKAIPMCDLIEDIWAVVRAAQTWAQSNTAHTRYDLDVALGGFAVKHPEWLPEASTGRKDGET